jgi:hypothetical protein
MTVMTVMRVRDGGATVMTVMTVMRVGDGGGALVVGGR